MNISSSVYFEITPKIDAAALVPEIIALFPNAQRPVGALKGSEGAGNLLRIGNTVIAFLVFDMPQPVEALEPALKANFAWPEARSVLKKHQLHINLSVLEESNNFREFTEASKALAMATLTLARTQGAIAIFWSTSLSLLKESTVGNEIQALAAGRPPLNLWVTTSPWVERASKKIGLVTVGLLGFIGHEIEMLPSKESLFAVVERALSLSAYLLERGSVVKDGDTIGYSASEHLRVRFVEDSAGPLMQVKIEDAGT